MRHTIHANLCAYLMQLEVEKGGHNLVRRCLERLSAAEERDWVDTILAELVSDAEALNANRKALDVLVFALSLATINHLTFTNHLQVCCEPPILLFAALPSNSMIINWQTALT